MKYTFLLFVPFFLPALTHAEVIFSEIAWMGTATDANDEWIEIYNFSSAPTNLAGWTLSDGDALTISLSGMMSPHGVFVLERTDDSTLPAITADIIYTGALSNTGATLTIKDAGGGTVDQVVGGENWENIGGSNELKMTAQRTRTGSWVTGTPTPGAPNIEEDELPGDAELASKSKTSGGGGGPVKAKSRTLPVSSDQNLTLSIAGPEVVYVNQGATFTSVAEGVGASTKHSLKYYWNFGDLSTGTEHTHTHAYAYPGTYTVAVEGVFGAQQAQARHDIRVLPMTLTLTETEKGDVMLKNDSSEEINLEGFVLRGMKTFTFPKLSILKAGGTLFIPRDTFGGHAGILSLHDAQQTHLLSYNRATTLAQAPQRQPTIAYTIPQTKQEDPEALQVVAETVSAPETVTYIGNSEVAKRSIFARLVERLGSLFKL